MSISPLQEQIITADDRLLFAIAGPGSGKTHTIRMKTLRTVAMEAKPSILILAFNQHSAEDIRKKVGAKAQVFTYHAFALQYIHSNIEQFRSISKYPMGIIPSVLDEETEQVLIAEYYQARRIQIKNKRINLEWVRQNHPNHHKPLLAEIVELGLIRFDDLIPMVTRMIAGHPSGFRYSHVLIDEAQDSSLDQWQLVEEILMVKTVKQVLVFGDIDQSIYEWRSAVPKQAIEFASAHEARILPLTVSYRCPVSVINAANQMIWNNKFRLEKTIQPKQDAVAGSIQVITADSLDQQSWYRLLDQLCEQILSQIGLGYRSIAVLTRTNRDMEAVKRALSSHGIAMIETMDRRANPEAMALLNFAEKVLESELFDQTCSKAMRLINPAFDQVEFYVRSRKYGGEIEMMKAEWPELFSGDTEARLDFLREMFATAGQPELAGHVQAIVSAMRKAMVTSIQKKKVDLIELLTETEQQQTEAAIVRVSTIHGAKGLEFEGVHIFNATDRVFPSDRATNIEEERRLMYVAITRTIVSCTLYAHGYPSQFITEMGLK
ncbi:MAG: ATP-dependent helicase [Bacteroidetes bacterium]|nr:ATP-dependent helicase [Bacteroidota bacterium]